MRLRRRRNLRRLERHRSNRLRPDNLSPNLSLRLLLDNNNGINSKHPERQVKPNLKLKDRCTATTNAMYSRFSRCSRYRRCRFNRSSRCRCKDRCTLMDMDMVDIRYRLLCISSLLLLRGVNLNNRSRSNKVKSNNKDSNKSILATRYLTHIPIHIKSTADIL